MVNFSMKMASTVTVVTLLATTLSSSVSAASEFLSYAELLAGESIIGTQSTEAGYRLGDTVTRAELAKVAANLGAYTPTACTGTFADVTSSLGDLCGYIEALEEAGVVASATNFRPTASVTRAEMVKMLVGVVGEEGSATDAGYMDLNGLGDLAMYINRANEMGCAATATYFRPNATASRGEAFKIAACVADLETVVPPPTGSGVVTPVAGSVSVALEGAAVAQYVPKNASSVKVGTIKLTAGAAATTVSSVVVTRSGLGNVSDISGIQLAQAGVASSDSRKPSGTSQASNLRFTTPVVLAAGTSASFDVLVSLSGSENNQHQFTVTTVNVVNGTATGTPVTLGLLNTTSYKVGDVTVGTLTPGTVTSGKTAQTFVTVPLTVGKDATLNGFAITKQAGDDFTKIIANAKAYYNGTVVGTVTVTNDKITVTGMNIARLNGETANIEIKADGIFIGTPVTLSVSVAQSTDVSATEKSTGYIMGVTGPGLNVSVNVTLNAVDLNITKNSTGSKTVAPGTSSVELLNMDITSDATFDVSNYTVAIAGGPMTNFVDDKVTIYVNGSDYETTTLSTPFSATADAFRVEPGVKVNVRVVANVRSTAVVAPTYITTLTLNQAKNVTNGQTVVLVGKSLNSDSTVVNIGSYTISKPTTAPVAKTVLEGSASDMLYFDLRASAENQVLKSVKVTSSVAFSGYATKVALMQGTTELKSITSTLDLAGTSFDFTSLTQQLTKDMVTPFTVRVTLKSGDVTTLGSSVTLSLAAPADVKVARSVDQAVMTATTSTFPVLGKTLQVSSNTPSLSLTAQADKNTTLQFANASNYDVVIDSVKIEMSRALINGNYAAWGQTPTPPNFLDAIGGVTAGTVVGNAPGTPVITPTALTVGTAPVTRVIELVDALNGVQPPEYIVTVKEVTFHYVDRTTAAVSPSIIETVTTPSM